MQGYLLVPTVMFMVNPLTQTPCNLEQERPYLSDQQVIFKGQYISHAWKRKITQTKILYRITNARFWITGLPMPNTIIKKVEDMTTQEGMENGFEFLNRQMEPFEDNSEDNLLPLIESEKHSEIPAEFPGV